MKRISLSLNLFFCLFFFLFFLSNAEAQSPKVYPYQLPNGLRLFVQVDQRTPLAVTQVWYKIGSGYEPCGISGVSHVVEHMMFKSTQQYGSGEFDRLIDESGGYDNAITDRDFTVYYEQVPAAALPTIFKLEADRMADLSFNPTDFDNAKQIVINERQMRIDDNPQEVTYERLMAEAYISSPYHHLPIGWLSDIQSLTLKDVSDWYHQWYVPNNAIVVVVGNVKPQQIYQWALQFFGPLKSRTLPPIKPQPGMSSLGLRMAIVKLPAGASWLAMGYRVPSIPSAPNSNDPYALVVINQILTGGRHNRFNAALIQQNIAANAEIKYSPMTRLSSLFKIFGSPAQNHTLKDLRTAILVQIQQLQQHPVSAQELAQVKIEVMASHIYALDSLMAQAESIGSLEVVGLPWQLRDEFQKRIEAVTPAQIQAVAKTYFSEDNLTFAELHAQPLPTNEKKNKPTSSTHIGNEDVH